MDNNVFRIALGLQSPNHYSKLCNIKGHELTWISVRGSQRTFISHFKNLCCSFAPCFFLRIKEKIFSCYLDQYWCDRRLTWLDIVWLCFDEVGLKRVSWAVRYLDKPQWRAVTSIHSRGGCCKRVELSWGESVTN